MSDFLADLQSYFASEERAREAELADASPAFERAEYAERLDRLRRAMSEAGVDVVLLSRPESMCWLHGYTARWYRHAGPAEWPALTTSVVRADRDEIIHFDFGGEEELLSATSVCRDVRIYPGEAVDGALAFLVRELTSAGWLPGLVGRERPLSELHAWPSTHQNVGGMARDARRVTRCQLHSLSKPRADDARTPRQEVPPAGGGEQP